MIIFHLGLCPILSSWTCNSTNEVSNARWPTVDIFQQMNSEFCYSNRNNNEYLKMHSMSIFTTIFSFWTSWIDLPFSESIPEHQILDEPHNVDQYIFQVQQLFLSGRFPSVPEGRTLWLTSRNTADVDKLCMLPTLSEESQALKITGEHHGYVYVGYGKPNSWSSIYRL